MSGGRASFLTARREVRERLRNRAFRVSTAIQVVAVVAIVVAIGLLGDSGPDEAKVGTVGSGAAEAVSQAQRAEDRVDLRIEARSLARPGEALRQVRSQDLDAAVTERAVLIGEGAPDALAPLLGATASRVRLDEGLRSAGLSTGEARRLTAATAVPTRDVGSESESSAQAVAYVSALLLYLAIVFCGYAVSSGVVEEKSTRVVELIMSAIKPRQLLAGKVVGIGLIGLGQLLLIVLAGLAAALAVGSVDLPSATWEIIGLALLYFVLGYVLYGCAFAAAGSIVSRQEDSSSTTSPLLLLLVAGYVGSISALDSPDSTFAVVLSLLPPFAPMVMPSRAASGDLPLGEVLASVALMVLACAVLIWVAGRIYERAVLRMGAPMKLREAVRLLR